MKEEVEAVKPMVFVYAAGKGWKLHVSPPAVKMLRSLKGPVALVSLCGRPHQDKIFILNQLLGGGFKAGSKPDINPGGLWLWRSPVRRTAADGTTYNLLFLDAEDIGDYQFMEPWHMQMISLAVLLSSLLICNQIDSIDDVALRLLSRVIEMANHIHLQVSQESETVYMLEDCSSLLFLLHKDFHLGLVEDNRTITPQEHLERTLARVEGGENVIAAAMNKMRESIQGFFPNRYCCALVRDKNDLGQLDQLVLERLRPEFRDGLAALETFVLERARPKQVGDRVMTGPMLVEITQVFVDALNSGPMPSSWQINEEAACLRAYGFAEKSFMRTFGFWNKTSKESLDNALAVPMSFFDLKFVSNGLGNGPLREIYRRFLESALEKKIVEAVPEYAALGNLAKEKALGNLAKEKVGVALVNFFGGVIMGSVSNHCGSHNHEESEWLLGGAHNHSGSHWKGLLEGFNNV